MQTDRRQRKSVPSSPRTVLALSGLFVCGLMLVLSGTIVISSVGFGSSRHSLRKTKLNPQKNVCEQKWVVRLFLALCLLAPCPFPLMSIIFLAALPYHHLNIEISRICFPTFPFSPPHLLSLRLVGGALLGIGLCSLLICAFVQRKNVVKWMGDMTRDLFALREATDPCEPINNAEEEEEQEEQQQTNTQMDNRRNGGWHNNR